MKTVIFLCACVATALCASSMKQDAQSSVAALRGLPALIHEQVHDKLGHYSLHYVTAEGTVVMETGELVPTPDGTGLVLASKGEVIYIGDDGKKYMTKYTAGIDGYKVEGEHLPVAPEVPEIPVVPDVTLVPVVTSAVDGNGPSESNVS